LLLFFFLFCVETRKDYFYYIKIFFSFTRKMASQACAFQMPSDRAGLLTAAKLAEQCERFDEMLVCMKRVVQVGGELTEEEKNLLSVAYKSVITQRRSAFRTVAALEGRANDQPAIAEIIRSFKTRLEVEVGEICTDIFELLERHLIPRTTDNESIVCYLKLKADYHRYWVEVCPSGAQIEAAGDAYARASTYADQLPVAHPVRLGLALNYSVYHYEIIKDHEKGYQHAKTAFYDAVEEIEALNDDMYRESATIMSLLRDNLGTWAEALGKDQDQDDGTQVEEA
jgi:14-3-3 protein epsilon